MFERFTPEARTVVIHAQQHARRLGHRYIGCEHVLLATVSSGQPAGAVMREHGITPEQVEEEIVRRAGLGAGAALFGDLDRDALSSVGIDLDAVRARIEAAFTAGALTRAGQAVHRWPRPSQSRLRRRLRRAMPRPVRAWHRRTRRTSPAAPAPCARPADATGRYRAPGTLPTGHLRFTPGAKKVLENALREAVARHDSHIGVEHVALGLIAVNSGLVPPILSALGTSGPALRAAILGRYRQAG